MRTVFTIWVMLDSTGPYCMARSTGGASSVIVVSSIFCRWLVVCPFGSDFIPQVFGFNPSCVLHVNLART